MNELNEIDEMQRRIKDLLESLKRSLPQSVGEQEFSGRYLPNGDGEPMDGKKGRPLCVAVPFSAVCRSGWNMSAEYYIPKAQEKAVRDFISGVETVDELYSKVAFMLKKGYANLGTTKDDRIELNSETLRVIRESEVGKHVTRLMEEPDGNEGEDG